MAQNVDGRLFVAIEGSAGSAKEAISRCGKALEDVGCVTSAFVRHCVEREAEFPTGLPTRIPVAIPHCQSDAILRDALCYLRLTRPVRFNRMDDDEDFVMVRHVFSLAIMPGEHLEFLTRTIQMIQNDTVIEELGGMSIKRVAAFLADRLT